MQNNSFFKYILLALLVTLFASCDKDFNEIGADIVGDDHFGLTKDDTKSVTAYNQDLGPIVSTNLPINPLGIYKSNVFSTTTANFATQLEFPTAAVNPTINPALHPVIDSIIMVIPYFSKKLSTKENGDGVYELDSIYGDTLSKMKLSVYESNYYIRDLDPDTGFREPYKYFTNQNSDFDMAKGTLLNTDASEAENTSFAISAVEHRERIITETDTTLSRVAPAVRLHLDKTFFKNKIIEAPAGKLVNNNVFKDYFRGLYFKVENTGDEGSMALLNFKNGKITIKYKEDVSLTDATEANRIVKTIVLNMTGSTVSLLQHTGINPAYSAALAGANTVAGDQKLFVRGGEGAMTVINLFGTQDVRGYDSNGVPTAGPNGVADELDDLRNPADGKRLLINEANLVFNIDQDAMSGSNEPNRLYLFDLNNNRPLLDYYFDTTIGINSKLNKYVHGGIIQTEGTGAAKKGVKYKIRITNYLRNLLKNSDSTNVKLGLVVTENIGLITAAKLKNPFVVSQIPTTGVPATRTINRTPLASVFNPLGTVLYGNNLPSTDLNYAKRLKLEIYYTKPD
ncbi:MAG: DUF4270 domain-containing protein [Bacteroidota bacterium]